MKAKTPNTTNLICDSLLRCVLSLTAFVLTWLATLHESRAVSPAPDGGYPGGNTAKGQNALLELTTGTFNTAVGFGARFANTDGNSNTALGDTALSSNIGGLFNVAIGADALERNTDGRAHVAIGTSALTSNVHGSFNTVIGDSAGAFVEGTTTFILA